MSFRKKYQLISVFLFLVYGVFGQEIAVKNPVRFLALGDSYTIGQGVQPDESWPNQLVEELEIIGIQTDKFTVIARTGWTTRNLINAIDEQNPDTDYNLVALLIGVNNQYQGININEYRVEFKQLLEMAIAFCGGRRNGVFVLSVPDYGYTPFGIYNQLNISAEIDAYNALNQKITSEMGISYFDITPISREVISKPWYLAPDSLHPSGEMYAQWVELIMEKINPETLSTNSLQFESGDEAHVYPNPANGYISIRAPQSASMIEIYNTNGKKIFERSLNEDNILEIDISGWHRGFYFYRIVSQVNRNVSGKFVVN